MTIDGQLDDVENVDAEADKDRGGALILALVMIIVGAMIVLPTLSYTMAVTRHSRVAMARTTGDEIVKGGLRTALSDPAKLYTACESGPRTQIHPVASGLPGVTTTCQWLSEAYARQFTQSSYSVATVQAGSTVPPQTVPAGSGYPASGNTNITAWTPTDTNSTSMFGKVWLPNLPSHGLNHPSVAGYAMPAGYPACIVYFPGTYTNPINITANTPVFFASGIYYFENTVTFSGSANVVIGDGGIEGCTTDQEAAFNAINAPTSHNITGVGATFIFGDVGRLIINDVTPGSGVSVRFNSRYTGTGDVTTASSAGVSIMTVNGAVNGSSPFVDVNLPGQLYVPASLVGGTTPTTAGPPDLAPSTNISSADPLLPAPPIVDIWLATPTAATISIPGYISAPQGTVNISTTPAGGTTNQSVQLVGGILAAQAIIPPSPPASFVFGASYAVVQKTLKIESTTTTSRSKSIAIVQVNSTGAYAVNYWQVQPG